MIRLKKRYKVLLVILLVCISAVIYGQHRWQAVKNELGLDVSWQGLGVSFNGLTLKNFTVTQHAPDGSTAKIEGENITLSWSVLTVKQLTIQWQQNIAASPSKKSEPVDLLKSLEKLQWLPKTIHINLLTVTLPCPAGQCQITGELTLIKNSQPNLLFSLLMDLYHKDQQLHITADLYKNNNQLALHAVGELNKQPLLSLSTQIAADTLTSTQGTLNIFKLNDSSGLFEWLQEWLPDKQPLVEIPKAMQLTAEWQFNFPTGMMSFNADQGYFRLTASLPNPWPVPKLGYLQGNIETKLAITDGQLQLDNLVSTITLTQMDKMLAHYLPDIFHSDRLNLYVKSLGKNNENSLPNIAIKLESKGTLNAQLAGQLTIDAQHALFNFNQGQLKADTNQFSFADYAVKKGTLLIPFTAKGNLKQADIVVNKNAVINVQQLTIPGNISLKTTTFTTPDLALSIHYGDESLKLKTMGGFNLSARSMKAPFLKTLDWQASGQLTADLKQLNLSAKISNSAMLAGDISIATVFNKQLYITAKTADISINGANPFAKIWSGWPALLEIATGKVNLSASLTLPFGQAPLSAESNLKVNDLSGIYDRSELINLNGSAHMTVKNNKLTLTIPEVTAKEANPGIIIGPIKLKGQYIANLSHPTQGTLQWSQAESQLFGGKVWIKTGQVNLAKKLQKLALQINSVQLAKILEAYPAEGLVGIGTIDGELPIIITSKGIEIKKGTLKARETGFLRFNSPKINALGKSNPNMQIVADALKNFRYTTLSSDVDYKQGIASLGLTVQGQNPDIEKGRPINLNVSLQENILALMTSLQLTDRVSEPIRKRVQERLQQQEK